MNDRNVTTTFIGNVNPFRYRGYYYDVVTGLYYLQTRYYDPETGRFISQDDYSYLAPEQINGLNLFAYCGNNPVMGVDPTGTSFLLSLLFISITIIVAAGIGALAGSINNASLGQNALAGAGFGAVIGAGYGLGIGLMIFGGPVGLVLGGLIIGGLSVAVGLNLASIVNSNIMAKKYDDLDYSSLSIENDYSLIPELITNDEDRMKYVNYIFAKDINIAKNWTKAQLLRELRYHYAGSQIFGTEGIIGIHFSTADVEPQQFFRSYFLRFIGNTLGLFY